MFTGCGTALVTPFRRDLSLDEATLRQLVRRQIDAGINFLVPCGTTGESPTLTRAEHLRVVEITLEEAKGKVPVLAGAGGYNTQRSDRTGARARAAWASTASSPSLPTTTSPRRKASISTTRPSPPPSAADHRLQRARAAPASTSSRPRWRAWPQIENIVGVKEASGNIAQMANVIQQVPPTLHRALGRRCHHPAADGPGRPRRHFRGLERDPRRDDAARAALPGRRFRRRARKLQRKYLPLMDMNFIESNPIPVKAAMGLMGLLEPVYRLPMCPPKRRESRQDRKGA